MYVFLAHSKGPAALAVSITVNLSDPFIDTGGGQSSGAGEIDMQATASGGDGSYSFSWTLVSENDPTNSFSINLGTTNNADGSWNDAVITTTFTGPPGPGNDPPPPGEFEIKCTVTDGTGTTASAIETVRAEAT
jgi:hypothetical protein